MEQLLVAQDRGFKWRRHVEVGGEKKGGRREQGAVTTSQLKIHRWANSKYADERNCVSFEELNWKENGIILKLKTAKWTDQIPKQSIISMSHVLVGKEEVTYSGCS